MSNCNDLCLKYKKTYRFDTTDSRYCSTCGIFLEFEGSECPCCNSRLRTRPKTGRRLRKYLEHNPDKVPKRF